MVKRKLHVHTACMVSGSKRYVLKRIVNTGQISFLTPIESDFEYGKQIFNLHVQFGKYR